MLSQLASLPKGSFSTVNAQMSNAFIAIGLCIFRKEFCPSAVVFFFELSAVPGFVVLHPDGRRPRGGNNLKPF